MRLTDLELLRWKLFHDEYIKQPYVVAEKAQEQGRTLTSYWKHIGAFVSTLPRQVGKTTMLGELVNRFVKEKESYIIIVPSHSMKKALIKNHGFNEKHCVSSQDFQGISVRECNLLIDEYTIFSERDLDTILSYNWKTVTMVGTLR